MYLVVIKNKKKQLLALVNKKQVKDKWWTSELSEAMIFTNIKDAENNRDRLTHNNPFIITKEEFVTNKIEKKQRQTLLGHYLNLLFNPSNG